MSTATILAELEGLSLFQANAVLVGYIDELEVAILGSAHCGCCEAELQEVVDLLAAPLVVVGAFGPTKDKAISSAVQALRTGLCIKGCYAAYASDGKLHVLPVQGDGACGSELELKHLPSFAHFLKGFRVLRCELPVRLEVVDDGITSPAVALEAAFGRLQQQLKAPSLVFLADSGAPGGGGRATTTSVLLRPQSDEMVESLPASCCGGPSTGGAEVVHCLPLLDTSQLAAPPGGLTFGYRPLTPQPAAAATAAEARSSGAVVETTCRTVTLWLDVLGYTRRSCTLGVAAAVLSQGIVRQLQAAQRVLSKLEGGKVVPVRALHFLPPGLGHHLSVLQPSLEDDLERNDLRLVGARQRLHTLLGLPLNRPLLRSANALDWTVQGEDSGGGSGAGSVARLRDVHVGLVAPALGGSCVLVQGSYEYCHYMQDRFNDAGWGCAYRSLQTVVSWFRLQRYTSKPIPSHRTIQQVLAKLGDKPPSFVGSCNWIGAIELSFILDEYLGVSSKFLTVNRGADIPSHARELAAHFASVGSPVMIGGGVLAYTLLGVQFNEQTGQAAFLILDPHYTGGEDLRKIQHGTWVGWKQLGDIAAAGGPLFVEDAFYNFLLPQRPNTV